MIFPKDLASETSVPDKSRSLRALLQLFPPVGLKKPILLPSTGLTLWGPKLLEPVVLNPPFHPPVPFSKLRDSEKLASAIVERGLDVPSFDQHRLSKLIAATGFCIAISKYFLY